MRDEMEIINEYEEIDFFGRMHLFLQYRDLRGVFQEMEHKESKVQGLEVVLTENPAKGKLPKSLCILKPLEGTK